MLTRQTFKQSAIGLPEKTKQLNMSSNEGIQQKIDTLAKDIQSLSAQVAQDDAGRKKLLGVTMKATAELETPVETVWRMMMSVRLLRKMCHRRVYMMANCHVKSVAPAALMVLIRMGIVTDLVQCGKPKTAKELSTSCGGDELLIGRSALQIPYQCL